MKTKSMNKKTIFSSLIAAVLFISVSSAMAAWDSSSESASCYGQPCKDWHNNGYTHSQYPDGVNFATFNGYKDAKKTRDNGTVDTYREMQFTYIESELASGNNFPLPTPWESWSDYNFGAGTNHTINFGNSNQPVKIGFWGYIHNNGVADDFEARDTQIKFENWASAQPKTIYNPGFRLWASNTKPQTVWSNVTLRGDRPFTLTAKEAYIDRESGTLKFNAENLSSLINAGIKIKSNNDNDPGVVDSSHLHYVLVYVEFEATPQEEQPVVCEEFNVTQSVIEINTPTVITMSTPLDNNGDPYKQNGQNPIIKYCFIRDNEATFTPSQYVTNSSCAEAPYGTPITFSATTEGRLDVWVINPDRYACNDELITNEQPETTVKCDEFTTTPGGGETVNVTENSLITVNVTSLIDDDGGDYFDPNPVFEYCFNGPIDWNPVQNWYTTGSSPQCVRTTQRYMQYVRPGANGIMYIKVVGSELTCGSRFIIRHGPTTNQQCLELNIVQGTFDDAGEYSVNLDVDPDDTAYEIKWQVERDNTNVLDENTTGKSIVLSDHDNYHFEPGDTLTAQAYVDGIADPDCEKSLTSTEDTCEKFTLNRENFVRANQRICFRTDWPYFDEVRYETSNDRTGSLDVVDENCFILTKNITENADWIDIWVPGQTQCKDRLRYEEKPPLFDKFIKAEGDNVWRTDKTVATFKDTSLEYKIEYTHYNDGVQDVTITDTIGEGPIRGYVGREGDNLGGTITYDNNMEITVGGKSISECDDDSEDMCYEGEIGDRDGITIYNLPDNEKVVITYTAELDSIIEPGDCSDPASVFNVQGVCGEKYKNTARFEDDTAEGNDDTELWIPCPFIIIRAGGDVVFENPLDYGVDTLYCADIANADVPIIIPEEEQPGTPSTGGAMPEYTGDICKDKNAPGYVDLKGSISSLICEISFKTTQDLTQKAIVQSINTNKEKISRFDKNLNGINTVTQENLLPESRTNVYYKNDGDLTFGVGSTPVEFSNGARTFIVEDHNVVINSNITYADSDPNNIASIAIIVINGSIIINSDVTETSGVFFVQEGDTDNSGKVCEGPYTPGSPCQEPQEYGDKQIIHYGSIYGDIEHLFKYRIYAGDPTKEEGALVIRFDNRVYINTPPVLNELVQISQEITS